MARYTEAVCRLCRREGQKLFLKGDRCYTKCALENRSYAPGQHGQGRSKNSEYGLQLREKQRIRYMYGVTERQFGNLYKKAATSKGVTGETFLFMLESRLDNLVYRTGFARSIRQARQMVSHGLIAVDGKKVDIPSYPVRPGQVITLKEAYRTNEMFKQAFLELKSFDLPYVEKSFDNWSATLVRTPLREELPYKDEVNETLIVELYSK